MRAFFGRLPPSSSNKIREAYMAQKPGLFQGALSGNGHRYESMGLTVRAITDPEEYKTLKNHSKTNMHNWSKARADFPLSVDVVAKDCLVAALEATKKAGKIYMVLNMANSHFPGGAVFEGGNAQEESMWHRSTCPLSLMDKWIKFDKDYTKTFLYTKEGRAFVEGKIKMTEAELDILSERCPNALSSTRIAYKTFYSKEPRICFRGPEVYFLPSSTDEFMVRGYTPNPELSFMFLPTHQIFPFYELRSAAPEHITKSQHEVPINERIMEMRRRISSQLDTLIIADQPNAILGAWGCGEFHNEPELVSDIYGEEIERRSSFFKHLMFPILDTQSARNFEVFEKALKGIKLGDTRSLQNNNKV